jgi:hypothetical protein
MTRYEAWQSNGMRVRVAGYKPARIGTIIGFELWGSRRGLESMYVKVDFGQSLPNHPGGIIFYKPRHLRLVTEPEGTGR